MSLSTVDRSSAILASVSAVSATVDGADFTFFAVLCSFVGVKNTSRALVGVADMENRVRYTREVLDGCFGRSVDFVALQQVVVPDDNGHEQTCLAIVVAQTDDAKS